MTESTPSEFVAIAVDRLRDVLAIVQVDRRDHALRAAVQLHNLAREAYGAGLDDFGDHARHAEVDALRWRSGEDPATARTRIAQAARHMLRMLAVAR